jgi:hypothetical protein
VGRRIIAMTTDTPALNWEREYATALARARAEKRELLVYFHKHD